LAHRRNAIKALRKNLKHHHHNLDIKSSIRKTTKQFEALVREKKTAEAKAVLQIIYKKYDKAAKENLLHRNTAARRKSRFGRLLKSTV